MMLMRRAPSEPIFEQDLVEQRELHEPERAEHGEVGERQRDRARRRRPVRGRRRDDRHRDRRRDEAGERQHPERHDLADEVTATRADPTPSCRLARYDGAIPQQTATTLADPAGTPAPSASATRTAALSRVVPTETTRQRDMRCTIARRADTDRVRHASVIASVGHEASDHDEARDRGDRPRRDEHRDLHAEVRRHRVDERRARRSSPRSSPRRARTTRAQRGRRAPLGVARVRPRVGDERRGDRDDVGDDRSDRVVRGEEQAPARPRCSRRRSARTTTKRRPKSFGERGARGRTEVDATAARVANRTAIRAVPFRSPTAVDTTWTRLSVSSTQSTGTSWMRRPLRSASSRSSVSKNQPSSSIAGSEPSRDIGPHRLEAALRVAHACREDGAQDQVVAARDELALRVARHVRSRREARADRDVGVTGDERRDEREERVEIGREVDVHVRDDVGVARSSTRDRSAKPRPLRSRCTRADAGELALEPLGLRPRAVGGARCRRS